jgi:hypothetical protein
MHLNLRYVSAACDRSDTERWYWRRRAYKIIRPATPIEWIAMAERLNAAAIGSRPPSLLEWKRTAEPCLKLTVQFRGSPSTEQDTER